MASADGGPCFLKFGDDMGIGIPARRFPGILQELESFTASDMDGIGILQYGAAIF
jgi:hypothetical protein